MNTHYLQVIRNILGGTAAFLGLLGSAFFFYGRLQEERMGSSLEWFKTAWVAIDRSKWQRLPETVAALILNMPFRVFDSDRTSKRLLATTSIGALVLLIIGLVVRIGPRLTVILGISALIPFFYLLSTLRNGIAFGVRLTPNAINYIMQFIFGAVALATALLWIDILVRMRPGLALVLMLIIFPGYWFIAWAIMGAVIQLMRQENTVLFVGCSAISIFALPMSLLLTLIAFVLGHSTDPTAYVPQTKQMISVNVICDTLTVACTYYIFYKAVAKSGLMRIPIAVLIDCITALVFAFASLYLGVMFTTHALKPQEVWHVMVGLSLDGKHLQLGPFFFVMHSAFVPTLVYLILVMAAWTAKAFLAPIRLLFGVGQAYKNPLNLTAAFWALIVASLSAVVFLLGILAEHLRP